MSNTLKKRVTISLDTALYARLDKRNRSGAIENIIKQHFQKESIEALYEIIKQKLIYDGFSVNQAVSWDEEPRVLIKRCVHNNVRGQCISKAAEVEGCNA